jgi:hypothetical protein
MNDLRTLLEVHIGHQFGDLATLEPGSVEQTVVVNNIEKLYKIMIDEDRLESEKAIKIAQTKNENRNRYIQFGLEAAGIVLPLAFYASWMSKGFKFEETGSFTSTTFRGLFSRFRPTK